jgi:eukaryotic-like serine/threonine-protein kinase
VNCSSCDKVIDEGLRFCPHCGAPRTPSATPHRMLGKTVGANFRLEELLGQGAMGTIFKATQLSLGKAVVIKLLHKHLAASTSQTKRFEQEARAASLVAHPNVIQIIDFGRATDGSMYIAMEYVPGVDLAELLFASFPLDYRRVIRIVEQICYGLDEAHACGVLHRDLKPENIMVSDRRNMADHVKVLDFGIAKLQEEVNGIDAYKTAAGVVCGTPEYMSPEQARGEELDARTDLYALGILLFQLTTYQLPFDGDTALAVVSKQLSDPPPDPKTIVEDIPEGLKLLMLGLMAKEREHRPQSAMDVAAELKRIDREIELDRFRVQHSLEAFGVASESSETIPEGHPAVLRAFQTAAAPQPNQEPLPEHPTPIVLGGFRRPTKHGHKQTHRGWLVAAGIAITMVLLGYIVLNVL